MFARDILAPTHLLLVLVVVMPLFGTKKLPEVGRGLGSAMREFKGAITGRDHDSAAGGDARGARQPD